MSNENCTAVQDISKNNRLIFGFGFGQTENNFPSNFTSEFDGKLFDQKIAALKQTEVMHP